MDSTNKATWTLLGLLATLILLTPPTQAQVTFAVHSTHATKRPLGSLEQIDVQPGDSFVLSITASVKTATSIDRWSGTLGGQGTRDPGLTVRSIEYVVGKPLREITPLPSPASGVFLGAEISSCMELKPDQDVTLARITCTIDSLFVAGSISLGDEGIGIPHGFSPCGENRDEDGETTIHRVVVKNAEKSRGEGLRVWMGPGGRAYEELLAPFGGPGVAGIGTVEHYEDTSCPDGTRPAPRSRIRIRVEECIHGRCEPGESFELLSRATISERDGRFRALDISYDSLRLPRVGQRILFKGSRPHPLQRAVWGVRCDWALHLSLFEVLRAPPHDREQLTYRLPPSGSVHPPTAVSVDELYELLDSQLESTGKTLEERWEEIVRELEAIGTWTGIDR